LALLGLGLGWLVFPFGVITSDMWVAEAYPLLSSYANPHFPLALSFMLSILLISYRVSIHNGTATLRLGFITAILSFLLAIVLPFGVVLVMMVLGSILMIELIKLLIDNRSRTEINGLSSLELRTLGRFSPPISGLAKQSFWVVLGGMPVVLYDFYVVWTDPVLAKWNAQNITLSPPLWDLVLSFSPVLIAACVGFWYLVLNKNHKQRLFLIWAVIGLLFLVLPLGLQRRFMMGIYVPLVGLASVSFLWLNRKFSQSRANRLSGWLLIISLPTILVLLLVAYFGIQTHAPVYYLTNGEYQAMQWIENNTPDNALILAAPETGIFIPAHTGRRVIYGHPFETVNATSEEAAAESFFADHVELDRQAFIRTRQVDFVFYGPREQILGTLPEIGNFLQQVYDQNGVSIYMVIPSMGMLRQ